MTATYTKLNDGAWGLRIVGTAKAGDTVAATTKAGKTEQKVVGRVLFAGNGITLATIGGTSDGGATPTPRAEKPCYCDDPENNWCPRCDGSRGRRRFYSR